MIEEAQPPVLIVEDEPLLSLDLEELLVESGFTCIAVATADLAVEKLQEKSVDFCALVTDIRTPGKSNGWEVAHRARELFPAIPVIYITATVPTWTAHGVPNSILLQKPFAHVQLTTALANLLNARAPDFSG